MIFNSGKQYLSESQLAIQEQFVENLPVLGSVYQSEGLRRIPTRFVFPIGAITDDTEFGGVREDDGTKDYTTPLATDIENREATVWYIEFESKAVYDRWKKADPRTRMNMTRAGRGVTMSSMFAAAWLEWALGAKFQRVSEIRGGSADAKDVIGDRIAQTKQGVLPSKDDAVTFAMTPEQKKKFEAGEATGGQF